MSESVQESSRAILGSSGAARFPSLVAQAAALNTAPATVAVPVADAAAQPAAEERLADRSSLKQYAARLLVVVLVLALLGASAWIFPRNYFFFRANWSLHPNEQEHLMIAKNLAETGSLTIKDAWYGQSPAHGSEDKGYRDGELVPRSSVLPYLLYAVPFIVSDTAWLWVTPFFGIAAAALAGAIVGARTGSRLAGAGAAVALLATAAVLLNSSGLALENVIGLAFLLAGVFALERFAARPSLWLGGLGSLCFALAAATRADLAPAGVVACLVLAAMLAHHYRRGVATRGEVFGVLSAWAVFGLAIGAGLAFNTLMYGDPLSSGYGEQAWQGSASGVTNRFLAFDFADFKAMAWSFLFHISKAQTALLLLGIGWVALHRRAHLGDIVLLALGAGLIALHLGNDNVTGGSHAYLVNSTPRYLQPVYATGVVIGVEAAYLLLRRAPTSWVARGPEVVLAALLLLVVGASLNEAYTNKWGIPAADRDAREFRQVHEFAKQHPNAVFIGDYNTKAVITGHTFIPRLLERPDQVGAFLGPELLAGHPLFVVDTPARRDPSNGYYSGYMDQLIAQGFYLSLVPSTPGFLQVTFREWTDDEIAALLVGDGAAPASAEQLLTNPWLLTTSEGALPGWLLNGDAWFVSAPGGVGVRVRNTAQYGGLRQVIPTEAIGAETVSGYVALRQAPENSAARIRFGLYDDETLQPLVETYGRLGDGTTYLAFEARIPGDGRPLRLVIASGRLDVGDFIIERAALMRSSLREVLGTQR